MPECEARGADENDVIWYCTMAPDHEGDHEAHTELDNSDEPCHVWPRGKETT